MTSISDTILIAGGTKGIGFGIADRLARRGCDLVLIYRSDDAGAEAARVQLQRHGVSVHLIKGDVGSPRSAMDVIDRVAEIAPRLRSLVHCAAVANPGLLVEQELDEIAEAIRVGGLSLLYLVQPALKLLVDGSAIIFLSGSAVDTVLPQHGALAMGKAAGECIVRYLAMECAPRKITVNSLRSGPVDTEFYRASRPDGMPPTPTLMGRQLLGADVAIAADLLLSEDCAMVTGQIITVDGGLSATVRREK